MAFWIVRVFTELSPLVITDSVDTTSVKIDYADLVAVMLTGVSIVLAALGLVVALIAVIGWNSIGDRVSSLATAFLQKSVKEGGELHELVKQEAKSIIYRGIDPVDPDFSEEPESEEEK